MHLKYIQIIVLASVFALQYLAEHVYPQKKEINNWKNEKFNLLVGIINIPITFLPATLLVQWLALIEKNKLGIIQQLNIPVYIKLVIVIIVMDLWMYAWHRLNHRISFLWHFHSFHHKDTHMNSTTALRFHTVELFFSYPGKALVCFLLGISYLPLVVYESIFFIAVLIHHSNIKITSKQDRVYRILFASPLMHRVHHSIRKEETNSNFGAVFSFWDRLFASATPPSKDEVIFGLPKK